MESEKLPPMGPPKVVFLPDYEGDDRQFELTVTATLLGMPTGLVVGLTEEAVRALRRSCTEALVNSKGQPLHDDLCPVTLKGGSCNCPAKAVNPEPSGYCDDCGFPLKHEC